MEDNSPAQQHELARREYLKSLTVAGMLSAIGSETAQALSTTESPQFDTGHQQRLVTDETGDVIVTNEHTQPVGPGVELRSFDQLTASGWIRVDMLTIELGENGASAGLLSPGVSLAAPVSELAEKENAIAGTNGDFFDIGNTNAPSGVEVGDGEIHKSGRSTTIGTGTDGVARLMEITLDGSVLLPESEHTLDSLNESSLNSNELGLYTPVWGDASLGGVAGDSSTVREVRVVDGSVTSISTSVSEAPIPENGYTLIGREDGAEALSDLSEGDDVEVSYAASTDASSPPEFAIGGNTILVRDGSIRHEQDESADRHPRTAAGTSDGSTLYLLTVDGRQSFSRGVTYFELAALMKRQGATNAINLDGGGSSTLVARSMGTDELAVFNSPSDGSERVVPNGVGVFAPEGSNSLDGFHVSPRSDSAYAEQVFPGLHREFFAYGYDDSYAPVDTTGLSWQTVPGSIGRADGVSSDRDEVDSRGVFTAHQSGDGTVRARRGGTTGGYEITVLGELNRIECSESTVGLAGEESTATVELIGYDKEGYRAPIEPQDIELSYDESIVSIENGATEFVIAGESDSGSTLVEMQVGDLSTFLPVTVGLSVETVSDFENPNEWDVFTVPSIPASIDFVPGRTNRALELTYDFSTTDTTRAAYANPTPTIELPGEPQLIGLWINGDGNGAWLRGKIIDATDTASNVSFAHSVDWTGWRYVEATIPDGVEYPIRLDHVYPVETSSSAQYSGTLLFDTLSVSVAPSVERPDDERVRDSTVLVNEEFDESALRFAVMADTQFTAETPDSSIIQQARRTLQEIVDADPEFLIINGDFVDRGTVPDLELAQSILEDEIGDSLPYYYIPGNHELEGADSLSNFQDTFGDTRRTFDRDGTRFVLLNSASGSFRTSDFDQLLDLQQTIEEAKDDDTISGMVVVAHHPPDDPLPADNSQLGDRQEAALIKRWLREFEIESGKESAYIGAHASVAHATHLGGASYFVMPTSGKDPYGPPSNGGFTGWAMFGLNPSTSDPEWLQVAMRPHVNEIRFEAPSNVEVGNEVTVTATAVQPGKRQIPLGYPATVRWNASEGVFVGNETEVAEVREEGTHEVVYDYVNSSLTALAAGEFSITAEVNDVKNTFEFTVDSKIAYLEPETTEATVGERISFDVRDGTDDGTWIDSLEWAFGDSTTGTGWWNAHRYDTAGEYQVSLTATDNTGQETVHNLLIEVSELGSPLASIEPSMTDIQTDERVTFRVEDTTGNDRWIDSLEWAFGDGATDTGWWTEHRYEDTGRYTVVLNVTDNTGNTTADEVTIEVS